jgi:hypothetical protein
VLTKSTLAEIEKFEANGGKVFVTYNSPIKPTGSIVIPKLLTTKHSRSDKIPYESDHIKALIRPYISPVVYADSPMFAIYHAYYGETMVIFAINWDIMFEESRLLTMKVKGDYSNIYEIVKGMKTSIIKKDGSLIIQDKIEKGGWRIYLLTKNPPQQISAEFSIKNRLCSVSVAVKDKAGKTIPWPVVIKLKNPDGKVCYQRSLTTEKKKVKSIFPLSSLTDKKGMWSVEIYDPVTNLQIIKKASY